MEIPKSVVDKMKAGDIIQIHREDSGPFWGFFYWEHTLMYIGNDTMIHAGAPVKTANIYEYFSNNVKITNYVILRPNGITQAQKDSAVNFVKNQIGKPYELWSLFRFTKQVNPEPDNLGYGYYCTELVWAAYFQAGLDLEIAQIGLVNPMEIYMSRKLDIIHIISRLKVRFPWYRYY